MNRIVSILLILCLSLSFVSTGAFNITAFAVTSGTTGDCIWALDGTVLTISGNGEMEAYYGSSTLPWGKNITKVIIENGVTSIGNGAFCYCSNLTTVTIGDSVTTIGVSAFDNCSSLTTVSIPDSVTTIGDGAFLYCSGLTTVTIGNSVTTIGIGTFRGCTRLTTVNYFGNENDRANITIGEDNDLFLNAQWVYNGVSTPEVEIKDTSKIFTDIKAKAWYKQYVDYSVAYGIFTGTSANTFSPNSNITRAQFVQVLANLQGVDTTNRNVQTEFSDVPAKKWYTAAVKWASENKIVNGMGGGLFKPNANVTREQMCLMLVNYAKFNNLSLNEVEAGASFADDAKISKWAKSAVYTCQMADIVNGKGGGKFDPQGTGTRAEACVMFTKFHKDYMTK